MFRQFCASLDSESLLPFPLVDFWLVLILSLLTRLVGLIRLVLSDNRGGRAYWVITIVWVLFLSHCAVSRGLAGRCGGFGSFRRSSITSLIVRVGLVCEECAFQLEWSTSFCSKLSTCRLVGGFVGPTIVIEDAGEAEAGVGSRSPSITWCVIGSVLCAVDTGCKITTEGKLEAHVHRV